MHVYEWKSFLFWLCRYHSIHHKDKQTNFCLFMPLYDILGKTTNIHSWDLHKELSSGISESLWTLFSGSDLLSSAISWTTYILHWWTEERVPDFVFLAHVVDMMSSMHAPFAFLSFNSIPFTTKLFLIPFWPFSFLSMLGMWAKSKTFLFTFYHLRGRLHQTWVVPRYGFQVTSRLFQILLLIHIHICILPLLL